MKVLLILFLKTKIIFVYFYLISVSKIQAKFFKIQTFSLKTSPNKFFQSTLIKIAGSAHPNTTNTILVDSKGRISTSTSVASAL